MKKNLPASAFVMTVAGALVTSALGAVPTAIKTAELADLDLEQLTRITVTSAARRPEPLSEAAASLYVITQEEIRRSGATSIPEVLRLAPNLQVARADTNQYAISARGFNNVLANKLLVLIDGRTVYTPLFSGVFWEAQDLLLADIERIEVISGPGGTLWGSNAMNGVINIITLPAARTQGTYAFAGGGTREDGVAVRHGGAMGDDGHFRVYAKYLDRDSSRTVTGANIGDASRMFSGGGRLDWGSEANRFTLQGDAYQGDVDNGPKRDFTGQNVLARWTKRLEGDSNVRVQAYYDRTTRNHDNLFHEDLQTLDADVQHTFRPWTTHEVVWGGGYRYSRDRVENSAAQAFIPPNSDLSWANLFVQDEMAIMQRLSLTLGAKAERNPYTGTEWLPSARLAWQQDPRLLLWSALSRAVRAPSRLERDLFVPGNPPFILTASGVFESEVADVGEIGMRSQLTETFSSSITLFRQRYTKLRSVGIVSGAPAFSNDIEGSVKGVEAWGSWRAAATWRITGGFVLQNIDLKVKEGAIDLGGLPALGNDPRRWAQLRSAWTPQRDIDFDVGVRYVGALEVGVPAYTTFDARVAWRPVQHVELSFTAQNAANRDHFEWNNRVLVERSLFFKVAWRP